MSTLIMFKGHPGTGKSTLSRRLSNSIGWEMISRDDIKEQLLADGIELDKVGTQSYEILWETLEDKLAAQTSIICDTNINQPIALEHLSRIQANTSAQIIVINCVCSDEDEHKRRLNARQEQGLSGFWIDSWQKYQDYLKSSDNQGDYTIPYPTILIDTSTENSLEGLITEIKTLASDSPNYGPENL